MNARKSKYVLLFSNTAIFAISNVLSKLVLSLLLPLYTRVLSTADYGTAELVTSISQLVVPICSLSIQDAVFRFSMDRHKRSDEVLKQSAVVLGIAVVLLLVVSSLLGCYSAVSKWKSYFFFISCLTMTRSVLSVYSKAIGKTAVFSVDNVLYNLILCCSNIVFLLSFKTGLSGYFSSMIVANVLSIVYLSNRICIFRALSGFRIDKNLLAELTKYSTPLVLNSISWGLTHVVDRVMLTAYGSTSAAGLYSAASKIPSILSLFTGVFTQAWSLSVIKDYERDKDVKFYESVFSMTHIAVCFVSAFILVVNNNILVFILGDQFSSASRYVPVLLLSAVFLTYSNYYSSIYAAMKKSKQIMLSSVSGGIVNVVLNALLIPRMGIMGACIATSISYIAIALFRMINCNHYCHIDIRPAAFTLTVIQLCVLAISSTVNRSVFVCFAVTIILILFLYRSTIMDYIHGVISIIRRKNSQHNGES